MANLTTQFLFSSDEGSSCHAVTKCRKTSAGEESWKDQADTKTSTTGLQRSLLPTIIFLLKTCMIYCFFSSLPLLSSLIVQQQTVTLPQLIRFRTTSGSLLDQIRTRYWDLGVLLLNDDTGAVTQAIVDQYHEDTTKINREILKRWIQDQGMPVKWATLIEVLKDIGLTELAREMEENFYTEEVN